jgi:hypothetical protein
MSPNYVQLRSGNRILNRFIHQGGVVILASGHEHDVALMQEVTVARLKAVGPCQGSERYSLYALHVPRLDHPISAIRNGIYSTSDVSGSNGCQLG